MRFAVALVLAPLGGVWFPITSGPMQKLVTLTASAGGTAVSVSAGVHWSIPLPNEFDVALGNNLELNASKDANGIVSDHFRYVQTDDGVPYAYAGTITCLQTYGSRVKLGGLIESSTDSTVPAGS